MKLGTLRFSRQHRAARACMAHRGHYRGSQWDPAVLAAYRTAEALQFGRIKTGEEAARDFRVNLQQEQWIDTGERNAAGMKLWMTSTGMFWV